MMRYYNLINERVHDLYWKEDLNCAITALQILSEIFDINLCSQILDSALGMSGAGRLGAQCGLVEGSLMLIGILGKERCYESKDIVTFCYNFSNAFQKAFGSLVCRDLRPQGFKPENPPHLCEDLTKKAIGFATNYINRTMSKT